MGFGIPSLYAILDADAAERRGWALIDLARAYINGGARLLQIRAKGRSGIEFLGAARAIVEIAHRAEARVLINDRADIAQLAGADGVHVGQDDLPPAAVRTLLGDAAIVGLSTHTPSQVEAAVAEPIDYVAIGPVFGTDTKSTGYESVGLDAVRHAAALARPRGLPVVAIGGITLDQVGHVIRAGAASVAVIADLMATGDPESRVRAFVEGLTL